MSIKKISFLLTISSLMIAQNSQSLELPQIEESNTPVLYREYGSVPIPLEQTLDPEKYILGPGDRLRINITGGLYEESISKEWSIENIDNFVLVVNFSKAIIPK